MPLEDVFTGTFISAINGDQARLARDHPALSLPGRPGAPADGVDVGRRKSKGRGRSPSPLSRTASAASAGTAARLAVAAGSSVGRAVLAGEAVFAVGSQPGMHIHVGI